MLNVALKLPRTVWFLGAVSFLNDAASDAIYPLLPLFFAATFAVGAQALGIIEGAANATAALMKLVSGYFYDRSQRAKGWLIIGYTLPALSRPLIALASSTPVVLLLRMGDRIGKGLRTSPRDALLAAAVPADRRGLAYGLHRSMDHAGAVAGPLAAAALLAAGWSVREVILWTIVPGVLSVLLVAMLREPEGLAVGNGKIDWQWQSLPAPLKRYLVALGVFTLSQASNMFLLLRAKETGFTDTQIPLLWAGFSALAMLLSTPLSALSDRVDRRSLLCGAWVVYALLFAAFGLLPSRVGTTIALFVGYAIFIAATEGAEKALIAELAPQAQLGTAFGWFHLVSGVMLLPASALFGWLWSHAGSTTAFMVSASTSFIAAGLLLRARRAER
ncbi:MAG TPA: MFS transporter [Casimicrobium huifangae]|jgi:MFS family permease|uniref:MFS transporter n=1 Tax=Casimicrobium huifangae TaxID=2591109 RepID=UPI0012EC8A4C|nr:MFS transporter [Casimicrobium huifangae]HQA32977.1 MFS transporter [Casimicrobium huifangae]